MTGRSRLSHFSVRQRLTAAVAVLTGLALTAAGLALYLAESRRVDHVIANGLSQEIAEFRELAALGTDPDTGQPFTSADRLLTVFLERNLPDANEMLFIFPLDGLPRYQGQTDRQLQRSTELVSLVQGLEATGGTRTLQVGSTTYRVAVQPVTEADRSGAFVVTHDVSAARAELRTLIGTYAVVSALSLVLISAVAWFIAGRLLHPVRRLNETAQSISEGDLSARLEVTGNDDLTELQRTFNEMLDRLEAAFVAQRQLLDDAGHELRTPLTILRGHLELVDPHDPEDVAATRALLLDETDRMARLVDDLLMLAKARRPDFVRPEPTDVAALTHGVLDRSRGLAERSWVLDDVAEGTVGLDAQRVMQAMLQLADNAVKHTGPGDEIAIGSRQHEGRLELWVRDTGRGVPPEHRESIFERFSRAEETEDGFGLGLSIVAAIVQAHGGTVVLDETPTGATFRLRFPYGGHP